MLVTLSKKNLKKINEVAKKYSGENTFILTRNLLIDCILDELSYTDLVKFFEIGGNICVEEEDFVFPVVDVDFVNKSLEHISLRDFDINPKEE